MFQQLISTVVSIPIWIAFNIRLEKTPVKLSMDNIHSDWLSFEAGLHHQTTEKGSARLTLTLRIPTMCWSMHR